MIFSLSMTNSDGKEWGPKVLFSCHPGEVKSKLAFYGYAEIKMNCAVIAVMSFACLIKFIYANTSHKYKDENDETKNP
jgi:hypothetical protein